MQARSRIREGPLSRMVWPAIVAGVFIALAIHIVLGLFGAALGTAAQAAESTSLAVLAGIWGLVVPLTATFVGALVAVRMARAVEASTAMLHGLLVWGIGIVAGALFLAGTAAGAAFAGAAMPQGMEPPGLQTLAGETAAALALSGLAGLFGLLGGALGAMAGRNITQEAQRSATMETRGEISPTRGDLEREGVRTREPDRTRRPPEPPDTTSPVDFTRH